jgi:uncharacterized membrane protein (DUF373 family)
MAGGVLMKGKLAKKLVKGVFWLEVILAVFIVVGVIISSLDLLRYFKVFYTTPPLETFSVVQNFLGHALILVIGLELVIMLVTHTPSSVMEVLLYAVARKIIIESKTMVDILIGIAAIGLLFFITKRFSPGKYFIPKGLSVSPATPIQQVNRLADVNIPEELGNTIGGAIIHVCKERGEKAVVGKCIRIADAEINILSMENDLIHRISVCRVNEEDGLMDEI